MRPHHVRVLSLAAAVLTSTVALAANQGAESAALKQFNDAVNKYVSLRDSQGKLPRRPTDSPEEITEQRQQLAAKVQQTRSDAAEGNIFTPEVAELFRADIRKTFAGPQGNKIRTSLKHAEPLHGITVKANQLYPEGIPLQSTPPSLLLSFPRLPKGLQYRIVGNDLALLDTTTNLVVDILRNAIPTQ